MTDNILKTSIDDVPKISVGDISKTSISELMNKINLDSTLNAEQLFHAGIKATASDMLVAGLMTFMRSYFKMQNFKNGTRGFVFAVLEATNIWLREAKLYLLWQSK